MSSIQQSLSVFNKFNFEKTPIAIKFLFDKPEGIKRLDKNLALCEILREAQEKKSPFYIDLENQACEPGAYIWGVDTAKVFQAGHFGAALKIFKEARANRKIYQDFPRLDKDIVKYMAFSQLGKLSFDPDLLIILTDNVSQTEIILRAMSYTTGEIWSSKMTNVLGCAWLFVYPYLTGEVNYMVTGLGFGLKARRVFPEGRQLISIPYNWLPVITQNLQEMPWVLSAYTDKDGESVKQAYIELGFTPPQD